MTQEEKELLVKDICSRLPYNVICQFNDSCRVINSQSEPIYDGVLSESSIDLFRNHVGFDIKPYLRPMSSMTEEERKEYEDFIIHRKHVNAQGQEWDIDCFSFGSVPRLISWLNAHHFDYRGFIEKGLAIEVTEKNNPYKE